MDFKEIQPPQTMQYRQGHVVLKQQYHFTADNRIYFTETQHKDLHNHEYNLYVDVLSLINASGMGMDFNEIDAIYTQHIQPKLHHQLLNETLPDFNTTAENLALWLWDTFEQRLPDDNHVYRLQLYETPEHGVELNTSIISD